MIWAACSLRITKIQLLEGLMEVRVSCPPAAMRYQGGER